MRATLENRIKIAEATRKLILMMLELHPEYKEEDISFAERAAALLTKEPASVALAVGLLGSSVDRSSRAIMLEMGNIACSGNEGMCDAAWLAAWANNGFPRVALPHTYAASLAATRVPESVASEIKYPFDAVEVIVPHGLFTCTLGGKPAMVERVEVMHGHILGGIGVVYDHGVATYRVGRTRDLFLDSKSVRTTVAQDDPEVAATFPEELEVTERIFKMAIRLAAGVALSWADPSKVKAPRSKSGGKGSRPAGVAPLEPRTYQIGAPVTIDVRPALQAYLSGQTNGGKGGSPLTVQRLVSGHWKPRLAARVGHPVWIEPYWQGKIDAPVVVKNYAVRT